MIICWNHRIRLEDLIYRIIDWKTKGNQAQTGDLIRRFRKSTTMLDQCGLETWKTADMEENRLLGETNFFAFRVCDETLIYL
ncbi:hypothetical protein LINPERHAP2_LOCUS22087, partial [Linum perenne]